ncbi:hypothetical protein ACRYCC_27880 [Actinomadura scrupuli]|uniref:hypothetical protein n=1 Tax=Actinomadura scrupuli TaxID=559629 RepID=UPI003D99C0F4
MGGRHRDESDPGPAPEPERTGRLRAVVYGWLERTSFSRAAVFLAGGLAMLVLIGSLLAGSGVFGRGGSPSAGPERQAMKAPATAAPVRTPRVRPVRTVRPSPRPSARTAARSDRVSPSPRPTRPPAVRPTSATPHWPGHWPRQWPGHWPRPRHDRPPPWWWQHHDGNR